MYGTLLLAYSTKKNKACCASSPCLRIYEMDHLLRGLEKEAALRPCIRRGKRFSDSRYRRGKRFFLHDPPGQDGTVEERF